jgi:predicted Rossmann-fold nucleotide-binding protein
MKVLICGSRRIEWRQAQLLWQELSRRHKAQPFDAIITGTRSGVDTAAVEWARTNCVPWACVPANWNKHGKAAGPFRNRRMIWLWQPGIVLAFPGGAGTENMVQTAESLGVTVERIEPEGWGK